MPNQQFFTSELLKQALNYSAYLQLSEQLVAQGKTSGPNQSEAYVHYTKLNFQRMKRLNKTVEIPESIRELLIQKANNWTWLTLTEPWCGDAAQCVPVIDKMGTVSQEITTVYLLRDEHPTIMDAYLTNGGRSIPKLICLDAQGKELFTWGPRPSVIQAVMDELKAAGISDIPTIVEAIQKAYNADQQAGIYAEFEALLKAL